MQVGVGEVLRALQALFLTGVPSAQRRAEPIAHVVSALSVSGIALRSELAILDREDHRLVRRIAAAGVQNVWDRTRGQQSRLFDERVKSRRISQVAEPPAQLQLP